ncbi:MAG TPA: SPOR domain-containing protein [Candidatus Omnitrophota bacterium]|nr:SPOR domain-containing protein [Candidatus Omnitrophota bacterium]
MKKIKFILIVLVFLVICRPALALDLESLKADFLQGNYRRVIFEGQPEAERAHLGNADDLNYILGLSYLKEFKIEPAQACFRRILKTSNSRFKAEASLALADTYLISGEFQQAEDAYNKLINDNPNSDQKPAIWYRLSQLEFKRGNHQKGNDYLSKLRRDFPLSPELKVNKDITFINTPARIPEIFCGPGRNEDEYSVQIGFFSNSANANNLKDKLLSKNYPAYVESFGSGYRVRVGKFKEQKEALELETKLSREGFQTKICP